MDALTPWVLALLGTLIKHGYSISLARSTGSGSFTRCGTLIQFDYSKSMALSSLMVAHSRRDSRSGWLLYLFGTLVRSWLLGIYGALLVCGYS